MLAATATPASADESGPDKSDYTLLNRKRHPEAVWRSQDGVMRMVSTEAEVDTYDRASGRSGCQPGTPA